MVYMTDWTAPGASRERNRAWRAKNPGAAAARSRVAYYKRRATIQEWKSKPCSDCGVEHPWFVMDFDHRDGWDSNANVVISAKFGMKRLLEELPKCDLVCANCHRVRTHKRNQFGRGGDYINMTDYERGTAAWDIGLCLTRHNDGLTKGHHHDYAPCTRVLELRRSAAARLPAEERLRLALATGCSCGAGDSEAEQTSLGTTKEAA